MSIEYAIIVKNKTRLEALIERFNTKAQARFYIERSGGDFHDYEKEHETFHTSLSLVQRNLSAVLKNKIVERGFLPSFIFNERQVIVTVGQDGLVANTAKYGKGRPIVAVNPDPNRFDGVLLPFTADNFLNAVENVIGNQYKARHTSFAEAQLNDGQRLLAFNDLFIGAASHVSARYKITYQSRSEEQSSSGVIVSTKAGSTGWMSSVFNMRVGIHKFVEKDDPPTRYVQLGDEELMFATREPFASKRTGTELTTGILKTGQKLLIESFMPSNGVIFSDGIEADFMKFNSGSVATIGLAIEKANLVLAG